MTCENSVVDSFIGQRFGKEQQIEVIGWTGGRSSAKNGAKTYTVKCHTCAKDPELFGDGMFTTLKGVLTRGSIPCGCAKGHRRSSKQYEIEMKRWCETREYNFLGFLDAPENVLQSTLMKLECRHCGTVWETSRVSGALQDESGCPKCKVRKISETQRLPEEATVKGFMSSGAFPLGTIFKRTDRFLDNHPYWDVTCPICIEDEYVKAGLCTGTFQAMASNLSSGVHSCRCSKRYQWTKEQREYQIAKRSCKKYKFVGWVGEYDNTRSRFKMECKEHGVWTASINHFVNGTSRCPDCAKGGFSPSKQGHVYILKIEGASGDFTGYGISNFPKDRLKVHKKKLSEYGFTIVDYKVFETTGQNALDIENAIKDNFPTVKQEVLGFIKEATHVGLYGSVVDFTESNILAACV